MKRTTRQVAICRILLALILLFIWGNSVLPAEMSDALSDWVRDVLQGFFPVDGEPAQEGTHLLRKMAHFLEFACLGACLCWRFGMAECQRVKAALYPLLSGAAVACIDETIQFFVSGRHSSWLDVGIDTAGVLGGLILLMTGYYLKTRILQKIKQQRR